MYTPPASLSSVAAHSGHLVGKTYGARWPLALVLLHAHDVRDDLARLFDDDDVADADVFARDLFRVVQAGPADGRTGQLDGLQIRDGRDRAGLADLHADIVQPRGGFIFLELVGDHPARALRRRAPIVPAGRIG